MGVPFSCHTNSFLVRGTCCNSTLRALLPPDRLYGPAPSQKTRKYKSQAGDTIAQIFTKRTELRCQKTHFGYDRIFFRQHPGQKTGNTRRFRMPKHIDASRLNCPRALYEKPQCAYPVRKQSCDRIEPEKSPTMTWSLSKAFTEVHETVDARLSQNISEQLTPVIVI